MTIISKPKLLAVAIILIVSSTSFYLGQVLATPAPTRNSTVEPGSLSQPCTYFIYEDGTTPTARPGNGGPQIVGTAGQDMGAFMSSLTAVNTKDCFEAGHYPFTTTWTVTSGMAIWGSYNATVFDAGTNSMSILAFPNAGQATNPRTTNVDVEYLTFNSNGKTNVIGVNFNESINENSNHLHLNELHFLGNGWNYLIIGDGNEDSTTQYIFSDIFTTGVQTGCGDISWKTYTGTAYLYNLIYGEITGCNGSGYLHVTGNYLVKDSVLSGIILECQIGSQTGSGGTKQCTGGQMTFDGDWFCNGSGGPVIYAKNGEDNIVFTMIIKDAIICIPPNAGLIEVNSTATKIGINTMQILHSKISLATSATSAMLYSSAGGGGHIVLNAGLTIDNCYISGTTGVWAYTNGAVGSITVSQLHFRQNYVNGVAPSKGDYVGQGNGNYFLSTEPAGYGQSAPGFTGSPALPAGTGSGNQQADPFGWPVIITWRNSTNIGPHIVDSLGVDKLLLGAADGAYLYPGEHIYFQTALPTAWLWEGMAW